MLGDFFKTAEVDAFADWVIAEVKKQLPSGSAAVPKNMAQRAEKLNVSIAKQALALGKHAKLNIYKKARLAARVREGMSAHGYPESFVKAFSYDLLARLQAAAKQRSL